MYGLSAKKDIIVENCSIIVNIAGADPETEHDCFPRRGLAANTGSTYFKGSASLDMDISESMSTIGILRGLHAQTSGTIDINIYDAYTGDTVTDKYAEGCGGLYASGTGTVNVSTPSGEAIDGSIVIAEDAGNITFKGILHAYNISYSYNFSIPEGKKIIVTGDESAKCGFVYDEINYYNLVKEDGTCVTEGRIETVSSNPLTFADCTTFDMGDIKVGDSVRIEALIGMVSGGTKPYTFSVDENYPLPAGLSIVSTYGYIGGTPTEEKAAGFFRVVVTDGAAATAYIDINYGAITVKEPITGVALNKNELSLGIGESETLTATITPDTASVQTVSWSSQDSSIAYVDSNGKISGRKAGKTTVTVTTTQGRFTDSCTVYIKENTPEATVGSSYIEGLVANADYTIGGAAVTADSSGRISIEDSWRETELSIIKTNAEVKCNSDAQSLYIPKKEAVDISTMSGQFSLEYTEVSYDGNEKEPAVSVSGLILDTDYTVVYSNNTNAGTATATITGKGDYYGTVYKYFTITPIDLTGVTATDYSGTYDKAGHTFTLSGIPAGARVSYSDAPEGNYLSTKPARVDAGTTVVYFKIDAQNYKTYTGSARIEILPASIEGKEIVLSEESYTYDGTAKEPEVTVAGIKKDTDYTVEYVNNMNAGTATVTVTGTGNYTGTISKTFTITAKAITPAVSLDKTSYVYDGKEKKPTVTVKNGDTVLAAGNYIVTYQAGRINVGTYKVTVKMKGNYTGSCTVSFKINPKEVTPAVTLDKTSYVYDGKEKKPAVTVKVGSTVLAAENYAVTYSTGRKEIGTYKVTVTLKGNYTGSKTVSYTIVPGQVTGLKQWTSEYSTCRIKMSWKKVAGAEGYALYRATEKDGTYKLVKTVTETPCTNEGLKAGSKFYYKLRAYKTVDGKKVYGEYSDAVFMVTKPGAPSVTLTAGSKSAKIEWTKSTSANGYEVYMSTSKDGTYTKIKTANASTLSYTKTGLKSGQKYYIKVKAYMTLPDGSKVYSGWSQLKGVTPK